ncbi:hypothetical protein SBOR_6865 [Sclerotinia borealis F-4128]|uniref:Rhodopsin domain-containing protein n=1 Tax=Sclerotinia borealis (strain F-4128) TaxID=1432307 RepID=W9CAC1_SCLBF|nr:hypothetical protein SBOR_6865 [Sclerotinia borealis F-4128]
MVQQLNTACLVIIVTFEVIGSIFCFGRLASRIVSKTQWKGLMMWSDVCMIIAWVLSVVETVAIYGLTSYAKYGYKTSDLVQFTIDIPTEMKWAMFDSLCYNPILGFIKASMILLYLRLGGLRQSVRYASYALLSINFALMISIFFVDMFQCIPFSYNFSSADMDLAAQMKANATDPGIGPCGPVTSGFKDGKYVTGGKCIKVINFLLVTAGLTIFTDLLVLCIPIYMVKDLKISPRKKVVTILILCMGLGVTAVGICRLQFTWRVFHPIVPDPGLNVRSTISQIETGLALVTGCIPDLLPLLRLLMPGFFNFATRKSTHPAQYPYSTTFGSKKIYQGQSAEDNNILNDTVYEDHGLDELKLRPNNGLVQRETHVRGAASTDSLTSSQIEMFDKNIDDKSESRTIIKTIHFSVKESDLTNPKKTWSNV